LQIHSMRKFNPPSVKLTANGLQGDGLMYFWQIHYGFERLNCSWPFLSSICT
jgi:hypothetical protein